MNMQPAGLLLRRQRLQSTGIPSSTTGWNVLRPATNSRRGDRLENSRCIRARDGMVRRRRAIMVLPRKCPPVTKTAASLPFPRTSAHRLRAENIATGNART